MNRNERCRILINGSSNLLQKICTDIEHNYISHILDKPNEAMVMVRMRDTAGKTPFYMGEVLVTESRVQVEGAIGLGLIKGHHPKQAYRLAMVDGAFNAQVDRCSQWESWMEKEKEVLQKKMKKEASRILRTKVDFSTMEDQGVEMNRD